MSLIKEGAVKRERKKISRHEKEMAIQLAEMENYRWIRSEREGCDVGKRAYFEWIQHYSERVRNWLDNLSDDKIDSIYQNLSEKIRFKVEQKVR